jgi:Tfp pilus assembly protein PilF
VLKIANDRARRYKEQIERLGKSKHKDADTERAIENIVQRSGEKDWLFYVRKANSEKDIEKKNAIFQEGIRLTPLSPELLGNYAVFLKNEKQDNLGAEEYYQKALAVEPNNSMNLGNYAIFLQVIKNDYAAAEEYYMKALNFEPNHAVRLGNLTKLLIDKNDLNQAGLCLKRAFENFDGSSQNIVENAFLDYVIVR